MPRKWLRLDSVRVWEVAVPQRAAKVQDVAMLQRVPQGSAGVLEVPNVKVEGGTALGAEMMVLGVREVEVAVPHRAAEVRDVAVPQ